jgi:hypothetical protein
MNNVQQSTTVVNNTLATLRVVKEVFNSPLFFKIIMDQNFDKGIKIFNLLQSIKK